MPAQGSGNLPGQRFPSLQPGSLAHQDRLPAGHVKGIHDPVAFVLNAAPGEQRDQAALLGFRKGGEPVIHTLAARVLPYVHKYPVKLRSPDPEADWSEGPVREEAPGRNRNHRGDHPT